MESSSPPCRSIPTDNCYCVYRRTHVHALLTRFYVSRNAWGLPAGAGSSYPVAGSGRFASFSLCSSRFFASNRADRTILFFFRVVRRSGDCQPRKEDDREETVEGLRRCSPSTWSCPSSPCSRNSRSPSLVAPAPIRRTRGTDCPTCERASLPRTRSIGGR